jgi:phosphotransferase system enzyme I (PtsI)
MPLAPRLLEKISNRHPALFSIAVAVIVLWADVRAGEEIGFPLLYALPVGFAAWRHQRYLAYALAAMLPLLRIAYEFPWGTDASVAMAAINALIEIAAMALYAYLVGRTAAQTRRLKSTVTKREFQVSQLRAFSRMASATLQGRGLSPGMVEGVAWIHLSSESDLPVEHQPVAADDVDEEIRRLDTALVAAVRELDHKDRHLSDDMAAAESALLDVQLAMLNDAEFWNTCKRRVRTELIKVEQVVAEEVRVMAEMLEALTHEVMRERGADIRDVGRRVLRNIGGGSESPASRLASLPPHTILVARELLPSDMFQVDRVNLVALVTERNGPASHVAILARTRNIPAVSDIKDVADLLATGDRLLVDAEAGTVIVAPTRMQSELFAERRSRHVASETFAVQDAAQEPTTRDGVRIGLYANISRPDEAHLVSEYRLDGVGLFRSEFLFLDVAQPPTLDEQVAAYSAVARTLNPSAVVIRTMDFGGDKIPRFDGSDSELAFRMGKRGLAFSLAEKTMFRRQVQAVLKSAAMGDVRIMFPMVTGVADLREARHLVAEVLEAEQVVRRVAIGAMIETPAAVIKIHDIVKMVDFVSIGTNDLAHFILATDRHALESQSAQAFLHPSVLRATQHVVRTALDQGIGVSVCGEAAGNPAPVCLLLGMGVRNLSMNPFHAAGIRRFLRQMTLGEMEAVARDALAATTLEEIQAIAETALRRAGR